MDFVAQERALAIIAAWGADSARWPVADRAAVLALLAHPAVAAAMAEAATLDALLGPWARADVIAAPFDAARLVPDPLAARAVWPLAVHAVRPAHRWLAAGAMAAAVAAAVVLTPMGVVTPVSSVAPASRTARLPVAPALPATALEDAGSDGEFADVFTPTVDEESLI
jgi:hypothetical protein